MSPTCIRVNRGRGFRVRTRMPVVVSAMRRFTGRWTSNPWRSTGLSWGDPAALLRLWDHALRTHATRRKARR